MRRRRHLGAGLIAACAILLAQPARPEPSALATPVALQEGEAVGRLQVPRLGLDVPVFEGVSDATLRKGPGHIPETPWPAPGPGGHGNCVITGHRDASFLPLRGARAGDLARLTDNRGLARTFRLTSRRIVLPEAYSVTNQTRRARLTLITCYPFRWKGSAPYRLVWTAIPATPERPSSGRKQPPPGWHGRCGSLLLESSAGRASLAEARFSPFPGLIAPGGEGCQGATARFAAGARSEIRRRSEG